MNQTGLFRLGVLFLTSILLLQVQHAVARFEPVNSAETNIPDITISPPTTDELLSETDLLLQTLKTDPFAPPEPDSTSSNDDVITIQGEVLQANDFESLTDLLKTWASIQPGEFGIVVRELDGANRSGSYQSTTPFVTASTYKLFLSYWTLLQVQAGDLALTSPFGANYQIGECIESLLVFSSNDCAYQMGDITGWQSLDEHLFSDGSVDTKLNNYTAGGFINGDKYSTANDLARFLEQLYRGYLLDTDNTNLMLSYLERQIWRERIPAGIPDEITVLDKPGWLAGYQNDAAIVYGPEAPYVMVVMSQGSSTTAIAGLASLVYDFLAL
jgi:beta-lactamase class A